MSLREYLGRRNTIRILDELSTRYEIPATIKEYDGQGPLVFENVEGYYGCVVANVCDSREAICEALGASVDSLHEHLVHSLGHPTPCKIKKDNRKSAKLNLSDIPVLTHYQGEQGPYITSALVYAKNPDGGGGNVSYHRMDVIGEDRLSICIQPGHLKEYIQKIKESGGEHLDIRISIGNHPAVMLAASLRPPVNVCEYDVANTLLDGGLELFRCPNVDAIAPVESELVLEGRVLVNEEETEGPYVCVTGTMKESKPMPVVEILGAIRKENYIYQGLLGGGIEHRLLESIPNEVKLWKHATESGFLLNGINMTPEGSSWLHCVVSITKESDENPETLLREIFKVIPALKHVIVVDEDVNPYDMREVEWALSTRFQADKDMITLSNTYASRLDPSSDLENKLGCKLGFDATIPSGLSKEGFVKGVIPVSKRVKKTIKG